MVYARGRIHSSMKRAVIGVMGSGVQAPSFAEELGRAIARHGWHLLTGGGKGVMEAVSRGFVSVPHEGLCLGIMPAERGENPHVELAVRTPLGIFDPATPQQLSRNHINVLTADVVVILPGRQGTRNEAELCRDYARPAFYLGPPEAFQDFPHFDRYETVEQAVQAILSRL